MDYFVGQKLKNTIIDSEPSFEIIKIFKHLNGDTVYYKVKDINGNRVQTTTEDFLYPMD